MERLSGKVAVVTGASAGIGVTIVTELVKHGMTVVGLARRVEKVEELAKSLSGCKGRLHAVKADVSNEDDVVKAFEWVREKLGAAHVLVNNAGWAPNALLSKMKREDYKRIRSLFDTNVMGVIMCSNEAIKLMREKGIDDGHIININSVAGHYMVPIPGFTPYNASKHAVTVITEGLRRELVEQKSKIRVTSISPGAVATEIGHASGIPDWEDFSSKMATITTNDVTDSVIHALAAPTGVQIAEIIVRPVGEMF